MKKSIIVILIVLLISFLYSYDYNLSKPIETEDDIADLYENGEITEEEYIELWDLYSHPLDINSASYNDLQRLPSIDPELAKAIIKHRPYKKEKDIINAIGKDTYLNIKAFITFEAPKKIKKHHKIRLKSTFNFKYIDEISPYHKRCETPYLQLSGNFKINKSINIGIIQVRKWGTDHFTIYEGSTTYDQNGKIIAKPGDVIVDKEHTIFPNPKAFININTKHFQLILGNYGAGFGLGVTFNKSGRRLLNGFTGDISQSSSYDYKRLFGIGLRFSIGKFSIYGFGSKLKDKLTVYSGILETPEADEIENETDYELLASDMRSIPDFITKTIYGTHIDIGGKNNRIGFTLFHTNETFASDNYRPYKYSERMFDTWIGGVNFQFQVKKNILIQGEFGKLEGADYGLVLRTFLKLQPMDLEIIYRDFSLNYENPYSYTYATWDTPAQFSAQDEKGIKFNGKIKFMDKSAFIFKGDIWKYYSTLQTNFDGTIGLRKDITPLWNISIMERYRDKDVSRDINESYQTDYTDSDRTTYTYLTSNFTPNENLLLTFTYRYKTYMEHSQPQIKPSSAVGGRLSYKCSIFNMILSYKFHDDNLYRKYDSSSSYEFRELQFYLYKYLIRRHLKFTFGYKRRWYFEDNTIRNPDTLPERTYRFYFTWRF